MIYLLALPLIGVFCQGSLYSGNYFEILDGDTIIFRGARIRLLDIDAPELAQKSSSGSPIGRWSKNQLTELIGGRQIDVVLVKRGYYGRWLGVLYIGELNINAEMIRRGAALSYGKKLIQLEILARKQKKGIWKQKHHLSPQKFRRITKRD